MELKPVLQHLARWGWLLAISTVIAGLAGLLVSRQLSPVYRATTTVLISERARSDQSVSETLGRSQLLAETYIQLLKGRPVLDMIIARLSLPVNHEQLGRRIRAEIVPGTQLVTISAEAQSASEAALLANTLAETLRSQGTRLLGTTWQRTSLTIVEPATPPLRPVFPRTPINVAVAAILGLLMASGLVVLRYTLSGFVETPGDVLRGTGLETLAVASGNSKVQLEGSSGILNDLGALMPEPYRKLRARIVAQISGQDPVAIVVAGTDYGVGTGVVAVHLAAGIAQTGRRVILVDAGLHEPSLHLHFGRDNDRGLTTVLRRSVDDVVTKLVPTAVPNLRFLPAGPKIAAAAGLLASREFTSVIAYLKTEADVVIVACGSAQGEVDSLDVAVTCDAAVLVVQPGISRAPVLAELRTHLEQAGTRVLGAVLVDRPVISALIAGHSARSPKRLLTGPADISTQTGSD